MTATPNSPEKKQISSSEISRRDSLKLGLTLGAAAYFAPHSYGASFRSMGDDLESLKKDFQNPVQETGVNCWWWWLNGNVNKAAIVKDLQAMKSRNFHGAMIFDAGGHNQRGNKDIPTGPLYGSPEWNELFLFALDEAEKLGLEIGFNIQSGWNLGGPRVTPEYATKQITFSELKISGGQTLRKKLKKPPTEKDFYHEIAVLAVPLKPEAETTELISYLTYKLGLEELGGSAPDTRFMLGNGHRTGKKWGGGSYRPEKNKGETSFIAGKNEILNLSDNMQVDGTLVWDAPEGDWAILRFGYTSTQAHVSTSSGDWQGSVLDHLSKDAYAFYWNDVVEPIFKVAGKHVGKTLKYMETDSWEGGGMNWTEGFADSFKAYSGYDILNFLPIAAGYIIDDVETSNNFLSDFRKTIGDMVAKNHYAQFAKYARKYNMGIQPESAGPHAGPMDGIKNYGYSDIVMSEFWAPSPHRPADSNRFYLKQASSAAHIYGKKIVGAESFTTIGPHWNDELWHDQKSSFDHEICAGLNRLYFHTFTCSPPEAGLPGQEYFAGTHVNPQITWWDQSAAFIDYMHRTQSIAQKGKFVADVLYYYGDHIPNIFPYKHSDPAGVMPGFDYDVTDETIFLKLTMKDGGIVVPGGVSYRVIVLPDHKVLSMAVLEKIEGLLEQGAHIIGPKPEKLASLMGGDKAQKKFHALADKIWGKAATENGRNRYGKGVVSWGITARDYLLKNNRPADFSILDNKDHTDFDYIHYTVDGADIYFVTNQTPERKKISCEFRIIGRQPELWDALSGDIREATAFAQKNGITTLPLTLEPYGAMLVVFNRGISRREQGEANRNYADYSTVTQIDGPWNVAFDPKWGGPSRVVFPELMDWTTHSDDGIKYYSGSAVYKKSFTVDFEPKRGEKYFLQLGSIKDVGIAEVKINGTDKGVVWTKPFRVDVSDTLKKGKNTLEIKVVNSWYNRVAGDEIYPDKKRYTSTNIVVRNDYRGRNRDVIPLEPSGLLGPVTIEKALKT